MRLAALFALLPSLAVAAPSGEERLSRRLVAVAARLLDEAQISYVYGGFQVGDGEACRQCNDCLAAKAPQPRDRLKRCAVCESCSLDCSHFANLVFTEAGAPYPYLDTATMLALSADDLRRRYELVDVGADATLAAAGDLLVYDGHVVMLERRHRPAAGRAAARGDIVHATGGKDVRGPGEGIQRERFIGLQSFRGPLRRVLRHRALLVEALSQPSSDLSPVANRPLRPLHPRNGN